MKLSNRLIAIVAIAIVSAAAIVAGATWTLAQNSNMIYACANPAGQVRIVDGPNECRPRETALEWNIIGPPGPAGADGLHCWDLNGNGTADPSEDVNGDGAVDILDCKGPQGDPGPPGPQGPAGKDGLNCWDLNGNGTADPSEDVNGDGAVDVLDCKGPQGDPGPPGPAGDIGDVECWTYEFFAGGSCDSNWRGIDCGPGAYVRGVHYAGAACGDNYADQYKFQITCCKFK